MNAAIPQGLSAGHAALLATRRDRLDAALRSYLRGQVERSRPYGRRAVEMAGLLEQFVLAGGKRLRGILVLEGYRAVTGAHDDAASLPAAMAIELLHAFLLIHDDIIDHDDLRRGQPTFHVRYQQLLDDGAPTPQTTKLAEGAAMLGGDLLCAMAQDLLNSAPIAHGRRQSAQRLFNGLIIDTGFGELLDVLATLDHDQTWESVFALYRLKTARYSFEGPLLLGAELGGASEEQQRALSGFGLPLGVAFQLQDDIIGLFGSEVDIGKPVGSDLKEGKRTPLVLHTLSHGDREQRELVQAALGSSTLDATAVRAVAAAVEASGARAKVERLAEERVHEARASLAAAPIEHDSRLFLDELATSLLGRSS